MPTRVRSFLLPSLVFIGGVSSAQAQEGLGDYMIVPASEIGLRTVVQGSAQTTRQRVDRRVVSPFPADRRVIIRPAGLGESAGTAVSAAQLPASPEPISTSVSSADYINIGALDAPAPLPAIPPTSPETGAQFIDIGPYSGEIVPLSSFSAD